MRVKLNSLEEFPQQSLIVDDDYIPFTLMIENYNVLPETIYARNYCEENFIEFRFNKDTRELYEITLVAFHPNKIIETENTSFLPKRQGIFNCMIDDEIELIISKPMKVTRSNDTLSIVWSENELDYFFISRNCVVGIDNDEVLCAAILTSLDKNQLNSITGV